MSSPYRSPEFLMQHMRQIMDFYHPRCINQEVGGYFNEYRDDGRITDHRTQHLVSTTRFIFIFSIAALLFPDDKFKAAAAHGVEFLKNAHADKEHGGYYWILEGSTPRDSSKQCYGHAFVLLAYAMAARAGIPGAEEKIAATWDLLEKYFWLPKYQLYADEFQRKWQPLSSYRGQNCNMHMTEAMIAAYEATGHARYLDRAETLAQRICVDLAAETNGMVWEHYTDEWKPDWEYNKDQPNHLFRPYGYLPGHMTEWSKLLLVLDRHRPAPWLRPAASRLYAAALARSADLEHGGMHYSFAPDGRLCDLEKYHWVHCETLAAAACLGARTGEEKYWQDYERLWAYSARVLIDREYGCWYRTTTPDGRRHDDLKSPPAKTDYHPVGACFEILRATGKINI